MANIETPSESQGPDIGGTDLDPSCQTLPPAPAPEQQRQRDRSDTFDCVDLSACDLDWCDFELPSCDSPCDFGCDF